MIRKTSRQLSALVVAQKLIVPAFEPVLSLVATGTDKGLRFVATVNVAGVDYQFASDAGKVQTFSDADSFLKKVAKFAEAGDGVYTVSVDTGALLASSVPANLLAAKAAKVASLTKTKTAQNAVVADIDAQLALMVGWDIGNAAQRAKLTETQTQRTTVVGDIAAIDAEILSLA